MRRTIVLASLLATVWLTSSSAFAKQPSSAPGQQEITAGWTGSAAVIDGVIGPGEYSAAIPVHVKFNKPTTTPGIVALTEADPFFPPPDNQNDLSYKISAMYDDDNLYIAIDVADDVIIDDGPGNNPTFDDAPEIFIDGDQVGNDLQVGQGGKEGFKVMYDVGGDAITRADVNSSSTVPGFWDAAAGLRPRGYVVEFVFALSSIDIIDGGEEVSPSSGSSIDFNVTVGDDDNGGFPYNDLLSGAPS